MKKRTAFILSVCFIQGLAAQQASRPLKPGPEHQVMLEWCGEWAYSGRTQETPVGPATQFTGKMTGRPVLNGFAVEFLHEYYGGGPGGDRFAHEMGWYDPAAKRYSFLFVTDAGVIEKGATVPGDPAKWEADCLRGDKAYKSRGADTYAPDGKSFTRKIDLSVDGTKWLPFFEAKYTRVDATQGTSDAQELIRLEKEAWNAATKLDMGTMDRVLADDFIGIYDSAPDDPIWTKSFLFASLKSGRYVMTSIDYDDLRVRVDGVAAAITGVSRTKETFEGKDISGQFRFTSTWIKGPTGWRCVGDHGVRISVPSDSGKPGVPATVKDTSDEQELIRLQHEWLRAETKRGDVRHFMADEYSLVTSEGTVITKAQMANFVASDDFPFTSMTVEDLKVQVYGNTAVVKGLIKWSDKSHKTGQFLFTDTWLKRDGRWQCVATHESGAKGTTADDGSTPSI